MDCIDYLNCICPVCGKQFHLKPYALKRYKIHYCSKPCQNKARKDYMSGSGNHQYGLKGRKNASWKSDIRISRYGYRMIRRLDHPFVCQDGFVFEHRLVAEEHLLTPENSVTVNGKAYLSKDYVVHHKNGNRLDNRVENLVVMTLSEHQSMHASQRPQHRDAATGKFIKEERGSDLWVSLS